ncbi:MAG: hypothetical protein J6Z17_06465 [Treponema sp.]|nr:hypothetical protein [Treponema sp.]
MKKALLVLTVFTLLVFAGCVCFASFVLKVPGIFQPYGSSYRFFHALKYFFMLLPAIVTSGFVAGCSIQWKSGIDDSARRFSNAMTRRYKNTILLSLPLVLFLSIAQEVFVPSVDSKIAEIKSLPYRVNSYLNFSKSFLKEGKTVLALQYANYAVELDPDDADAVSLKKHAEDKLELENKIALSHPDQKQTASATENKVLTSEDRAHTVYELVQKSRAASEQKDWFNAHYYAQLAVSACSGTDTNLREAISLANTAWNNIQKPQFFEDPAEKEYFETKRQGYTAYNAGDYLKAYYIFQKIIHFENVKVTADVERFFTLSREEVENQYFFFDETDDMQKISDFHNVYFSVQNTDKSKTVFYARNVMPMQKNGGLVSYLEGFYAVNFSSSGNFNYSFDVPFAKVIAQSTADFSSEALSAMGISKSWKNVPLIILQSVDRHTEGLISRPNFVYRSNAPKLDSENIMILPIDFNSLGAASELSATSKSMDIFSLLTFISKAKSFGFSEEIYMIQLVSRLMYPLFILIILVLCAVIGWNYRLEKVSMSFKFSWIFAFPVFMVVALVIFNSLLYVFNVMNYVFVGLFGDNSVLLTMILYIIIFVCMSVLFMSRKK